MAQIKVKLPDGTVQTMSHPDDWSDEQVQSAIHEQFPTDSEVPETPFNELSRKQKQLDELKGAHPIIYGLAERLAKHPKLASAVQGAAESPGVEAALSAAPAFVNALGNVANLPTEVIAGKKIVPRMERPFPEPKDMRGRIGSKIGDILGASLAFGASPVATTLPGGLATGFAEGEGGILNRSMDALVGMLVPGLIHGGKAVKNLRESRQLGKEISGLELQKSQAERDVFGAKEKLAGQLTKEIEPTQAASKSLASSLEKEAGASESQAKKKVADSLAGAEKKIVKKYQNLYEGFNQGEAGQKLIKDPVKIDALESEYGLKPEDFSSDSRSLIKKMVGKMESKPASEEVSVITGKPVNQASVDIEQAKNPKVADYIDLWKQLRSEVAEFRHSGKMAQTPEAKRAFRDKANQLEKFSDEIHSKAMGSMSKAESEQYSKIQKGYLNERVPFLEKPILKNATEKFGEVPDNFFQKVNEAGVPEFMDALKAEHPEVVKAITQHDIKGLSKLSPEKIDELLKGDFGRFVPKEVRDTLESLGKYKTAESLMKKALGKVGASEIGRKVGANDINAILKQKPELAAPFKSIEKEQKKLRELKNALIDAGFKKEELQNQMKTYKTVKSFFKASGVPIGTYLGVLKAKSTSGNEGEN